MPGPFPTEDIRQFLADYGYTADPEGLAQPFPVDFVSETEGSAYLDISADAVRKGDEVPDRPLRITFQLVFNGTTSHWKLKSVKELLSGVKSKALDRQPETPKVSPWP
jgi:hypothetical protein